MTRIAPVLLGFVLLAACGELSRTPGAADAGGSDAGTSSPRLRCSSCSPGLTRCVAGECAFECEADDVLACPPGHRCLYGACWADLVPSCEEAPCNADQRCLSAYCVVANGEDCDDDASCRPWGTCLLEAGRCVALPPCNTDGRCHVGTLGAVCNHETLERAKPWEAFGANTCLIGRCRSDDDCPPSATCTELGAEFEGLGVCR